MRPHEAFAAALALIAAHPPQQEQVPAFGYDPGPPSKRFPRPAASVSIPEHAGQMVEAVRRLGNGTMTSVDLVEQAYSAIARRPELNAFTFVRPRPEATREAQLLDAERRGERIRGPLHGLTIAVKDVLHVRHMPTTASSRVLDPVPAVRDALSVARLREAGAIFVGKTSTHEFALGVTTPQSRNPHDSYRLAGGSSGGSAIAIAAGMSLGALGTDTRASIRVPAALCGVVGFKPTFGIVPTDGIVTLSYSMDHVAPIAGSIADAALLLDVLAGTSTGVVAGFGRFQRALADSVAGLRVGVPAAGLVDVEPAVAAAFATALERLSALECEVISLDEPSALDFALANATGLVISRAEAAAYHAPWAGLRDRYTDNVREQLDTAESLTAVAYLQAQRFRKDLRDRMSALLRRVDVLALPTCKAVAPLPAAGEEMLLALSENCVPWSLVGFPAVSLPCGTDPSGLPVGLELVAAPYDDELLVSFGSALG